jgi:hypothetical protein
MVVGEIIKMAIKTGYHKQTGFLEREDVRGQRVIEIGFKLKDRHYDFEKAKIHNFPMLTEIHAVAFVPLRNVGDRLLVNNVPTEQGQNLIKRLRSGFEGYSLGKDWKGEYTHSMRGSTYELRRIS